MELKKKIAKYEKAITQSRKMMSILSLQDELNDTETIPFRALPAVCLPYRYNDVEGSGEEAEEKQLHDQLLRVQKLVDEIPNCFNYRGWFEKESEGFNLTRFENISFNMNLDKVYVKLTFVTKLMKHTILLGHVIVM